MSVLCEIKKHMALAFFASAYADAAEDAKQPLRGEIMDQLPEEVDPEAIKAAEKLADGMASALLPGYTVADIFHYCETLDCSRGDRELTPEMFGHYCAMQAMGAGVGLNDAFGPEVHARVNVPRLEFSHLELSKNYFPVSLKILSIEAWAGPEEGVWEWNDWRKVGYISKEDFEALETPEARIAYMVEEGYLSRAEGVSEEDDCYNYVYTIEKTGEPLFAIEYGPVYQ